MKKVEKDLLVKDICARLQYGVFVKDRWESTFSIYTTDYHPYLYSCTPYLRSLSSMTEEEEKEMYKIYNKWFREGVSFNMYVDVVDWLNAHFFDYRGLIKKGLAIEATKENVPLMFGGIK